MNLTRRNWLAISAATLLLSACGFQLRGTQNFPFKRLRIVGAPPEMLARFRRMVEGGSDTVVVTAPANGPADAVLSLSPGRSQNSLSLNAEGQVQEFELVYSVSYTLTAANGAVLIPPSVLNLNRSMIYSDQYALAKQQEAELLYRDMQNDAVDQLMRRLASVKSLAPTRNPVPAVAPRAPLPTPPF